MKFYSFRFSVIEISVFFLHFSIYSSMHKLFILNKSYCWLRSPPLPPLPFFPLPFCAFTVLQSPSPYLQSATSSVSLKTLKAKQTSLLLCVLLCSHLSLIARFPHFSLLACSPSWFLYLDKALIAYLGRNKSQVNGNVRDCVGYKELQWCLFCMEAVVWSLHSGLCVSDECR